MTWLSLISSSLLLALPVTAATSVSGRVRLSDSPVQAVRKHQDYSGVVVWLEPLDPKDETPLTPRPHRARMEQYEKRFIPHVLAIQRGTDVYFPNFDPVFHSAFSNFNGQVFDLGLYAPGTGRTITFNRAGIVRVFCNIHPTMSAIIVVLKQPWFAVSDKFGAFTIPTVPPGQYQLRIFDERATENTLHALDRTIEVRSEDLVLPLVTISETGYVEMPHKNKYGHDYPPVPDDGGAYPADRK